MSESLCAYIAAKGLDETYTMNELQNHGIVSDLAVTASDVGNGGAAIDWLEKRDLRPLLARETARRAA